jgi:TolB-like protein/class 3 adenylate cyclase/Flp pilus assembly protein TadD
VSEDGVERRLTTILAADVVGYSRLMAADEAGTLTSLKAIRRELFEPKTTAHHGRVVKLIGDGTLMEFGSVVDAVNFAVDVQRAMALRNTDVPEDRRITYRMGINIGDIIVEGDDIYGDGVNIAARLEGLAEPGGICVARNVFDQLKAKVEVGFDDLGEQAVKNIPEPVRVFKVLLDSPAAEHTAAPAPAVKRSLRWPLTAAVLVALVVLAGLALWQRPWEPREEPASLEAMAFPLPDKPSIAVLPFTNLSDDPNQEYFVDGMTEDLITDLAKIESLFVIARNTVFTYKGKSVVVPDVARELGIRYVLEGSVRRVGDVVRINAQLIDGISGAHVWAERYDGTLANIFALQDDVTREIVAQLQITLTPDEQSHQNRKDTDNPEAYDAYLRGWQLYRRYTPEDFFEAIPHLERAVELDPDFGRAWATLASIYWTAYRNGISWALIVKPSNLGARISWIGARDYAVKYLEKAKRNPTPLAHQIDSLIWSEYRQFDEALAEAEQAVALDPNDPEGHLAMAWALIFAGRSEAAISFAENAIRLDPHFPANYRFALGTAQLMLERFTAAEATLKSAFELNPEEMEIQAPLAVAYAQLNKNEKAKDALRKYTDFWIFFDKSSGIETHMTFWPFKREADIRLFGGGLVKAGLCCDEQLETYIGKLRQDGTLE